MTNQEAANACGEIYNQFWKTYRDMALKRDSPEWNDINAMAKELLKRYPFPLGQHMILDFLDELEQRCRKEQP